MSQPSKAQHRDLLDLETALWAHGFWVGGVDEVGTGPLAGPVVAACVVLHPERTDALLGVNDSKALSDSARRTLALRVQEQAEAWAVAEASVLEIDTLNIRNAALLAMQRATERVQTAVKLDHLLVDARSIPGLSCPQSSHVKGDAKSLSVAAASILAKVHRDDLLLGLHQKDPRYGFDRHKGYGTKLHLSALEEHGPCEHHRRSFAPVHKAFIDVPRENRSAKSPGKPGLNHNAAGPTERPPLAPAPTGSSTSESPHPEQTAQREPHGSETLPAHSPSETVGPNPEPQPGPRQASLRRILSPPSLESGP